MFSFTKQHALWQEAQRVNSLSLLYTEHQRKQTAMEKATTERYHCEQFLHIYQATKGFDSNKLEKQESPDFRLNFDGQIIGIEHTRIHRKAGNIKVHDKHVAEVMRKAYELFYIDNSLPVNVDVDFKNNSGTNGQKTIFVGKRDVLPLGQYIACFLTQKLNELHFLANNRIVFDKIDIKSAQLRDFPEKISKIKVYKAPKIFSSWMTSGGGGVPDFINSDELGSAIEDKNKSMESYSQQYDKLWLLIVEDSHTMATYFDFDNFNPDDKAFRTAFDKVFVLRTNEDKIYELKTYK